MEWTVFKNEKKQQKAMSFLLVLRGSSTEIKNKYENIALWDTTGDNDSLEKECREWTQRMSVVGH